MTDIQADIMEIKQTLKKMQEDIDKLKPISCYYYNNTNGYESVPYIPTQGCSLEQQMDAIKKYDEYLEKHQCK